MFGGMLVATVLSHSRPAFGLRAVLRQERKAGARETVTSAEQPEGFGGTNVVTASFAIAAE